jgi:hypothetical protein
LHWTGLALSVGVAGLALFALDPTGRLVVRAVGLAGTALFILSIITMLLTFRNAKRLSPLALAFSALVSMATTLGFYFLAGAPAAVLTLCLATLAGLLIGVGWSMTSLLFIDPALSAAAGVRARGDLWFLAVWAATLMLPQLVAHAGARTPEMLTILSFVGMGLAVGNSGGLMFRTWAALRGRHRAILQEIRS